MTMLHYNVEKPESSYVQVRLFGRRKDEENFDHFFVNYKLDEFICLFDVMNSVYDNVIANEPLYNNFLTSNCNYSLLTTIFFSN